MPRNNSAGSPTGANVEEAYDPTFVWYANGFLVLTLGFVYFVERDLIRVLWLGRRTSFDTSEMILAPIAVLVPLVAAVGARIGVWRLARREQIHPNPTARLQFIVSAFTCVTYIAAFLVAIVLR